MKILFLHHKKYRYNIYNRTINRVCLGLGMLLYKFNLDENILETDVSTSDLKSNELQECTTIIYN